MLIILLFSSRQWHVYCQPLVEFSDDRLIIKSPAGGLPFISFHIDENMLIAAHSLQNVRYRYASFHFSEKRDNILKLDPSTIDVEILPDGCVLTGFLKNRRDSCRFMMECTLADTNSLNLNLQLSDKGLNYLQLRWDSDPGEHFFGFGEQASYFDMKGKKPFIWCEEQGIGRGDLPVSLITGIAGAAGNPYTSYCPVPFFISTRNRAMLILNSAYMDFDFTDNSEAVFTIRDNNIAGKIWVCDAPLTCLESYTSATGRFPPLPDWAYGTILGLQGGARRVDSLVEMALKAGNPVTAIWIQDWVGRRKTRFGSQLWWRWQPDSLSYPGFKAWVKKWQDRGIRVLGYINPFLADEGAMFEEAKRKGYLVKTIDGQPYKLKTPGFPACMIDLTNPEAVKWIKNIIKTNLIGNGLSGWMADYGEWLPLDCRLFSGVSPQQYHNLYALDWARINREAIEEAGLADQIVFFTRSGFTKSNAYSTLFWTGDQMVNWQKHDGLPSAILSLLSGGISGIALNHSDIGGYTTVDAPLFKIHRSRELLFRWIEANVFTVFFRTHEGLIPEVNEQVYSSEENLAFFARMGKLHYALKPYLKACVEEAHQKGYPVVRPLYLHYPQDPETYQLKYQFLTGAELLVIPVIKKGSTAVDGYFPGGEWVHAWSGNVFRGPGWQKVDAPPGKPAVFYLKGGSWASFFNGVFNSLNGHSEKER